MTSKTLEYISCSRGTVSERPSPNLVNATSKARYNLYIYIYIYILNTEINKINETCFRAHKQWPLDQRILTQCWLLE